MWDKLTKGIGVVEAHHSKGAQTLLSANDPSPVLIANPEGRSLFLLIGDHAGSCIPEALCNLGLAEPDLERHIALDIGVSALGRALSEAMDAPFIEQRYSRLVVDCNRAKGTPQSIAAVSDETVIPGNAGLDPEAAERRYRHIFDPYHRAIAAALDRRGEEGRAVVLISLHSFTPVLGAQARPWDVGVLHDGGETEFARTLLGQLVQGSSWCVGNNEPYHMDATDFTVPYHAYPRGLHYAEIEVRQDHLTDDAGVRTMAATLGKALVQAARGTKGVPAAFAPDGRTP